MAGDTNKFEAKLPARITGLVFWGLIFIGLLSAVILLERAESDLIDEKNKEALLLAYEIEEIVEQFTAAPVLERAGGRIRARLVERIDDYSLHAIRLYEGEKELSVGIIDEADDRYSYKLHYYPFDGSELHDIRMDVYSKDVKTIIADLRKNILLSIGFGVFIFGMFLQRVLQKMLAAPFQKMVAVAENFSRGKKDVRFDDSRADEFGYLGKFINDAIDAILQQQNELMTALERASASEIALSIEKERAEVTLHSITDSVVTVDINADIVYLNPAGEKLLGLYNKEITGHAFRQIFNIVEETLGTKIDDPIDKCFVTGEIVHLPEHSSLLTENNSVVSIEASVAPMKAESGDLMGAVMVIQDVSHTRRLTRQLSYQASHDLLTGLYNRRKFEEYLQEILLNVKEEDRYHSLFYLDLDNFKIVNDTCGHVAGDELLKQLPALFNEVLRSGDIVARLGGDEFGIILENCGLQQATAIADKIRQKIKNFRFIWDERTFEIGVSIGVIGINAENAEMSRILSSADVACYAAKDSGRNRVHVYEPSDEIVSERYGQMHWTARITSALENNRFQLFQQPIVGTSSSNRDHLEILLRMIDEDGKLIAPGAFMPAAERYGLMPAIDRWVIRAVFTYMARNDPADLIKDTSRIIAINLSGDSINDDSLLEFIIEERNRHDISLHNVCFEITETVAISNLGKASAFISELKSHGCKFALDDFGSGLSSFSYLKNLPVDYLKIDGSFVRDVSRDVIDRAMVASIQQVGEVMNLTTIAEHVEDESTLTVLREIGVDFVQGFHLGRPQAIENR